MTVKLNRILSKKTAKLVQENTRTSVIDGTIDIYVINEDTLKQLEQSTVSDTEKVFNLIRSINETIRQRGEFSPVLLSIGERAQMLIELYTSRQKTTIETLDGLKNISNEMVEAEKQQIEKGMNRYGFAVYWIFKYEKLPKAESRAREIEKVLERYPHWQTSIQHEREVRRELYKVLLDLGIDDLKMNEIVESTLRTIKGGEL